MTYYCGIDLHSNNHYVCVIDDEDNRVLERKLDNGEYRYRGQVVFTMF